MSPVVLYDKQAGMIKQKRLRKTTAAEIASEGYVKLHHDFYSSRTADGHIPNIEFVGPNQPDISQSSLAAITPVDFKPKFANDTVAAVFTKGGAWPSWLALSAVGVMSGTPSGNGNSPTCWVICTEAGKGSAISNVFSVTISTLLAADAAKTTTLAPAKEAAPASEPAKTAKKTGNGGSGK